MWIENGWTSAQVPHHDGELPYANGELETGADHPVTAGGEQRDNPEEDADLVVNHVPVDVTVLVRPIFFKFIRQHLTWKSEVPNHKH